MLWFTVALGAGLAEAEEPGLRAVEVPEPAVPVRVVLANARIHTATGPAFDGWITLADGQITGLGEGQPPSVDATPLIDLQGKHVTPGLIDTHSHLGVYPSPGARAHSDGNEMTAPTTPGVWAEHSVWPQDPGFQRALEGGITALQVLPGSANLIGGRGVVLQLVQAQGGRAMRFPGAPETVKLACGENPKRVYGEKGGPGTRMGNVRGYRQAFYDAVAYLEKWEEADRELTKKERKKGKKAPDPPDRDLDLDTLAGVLQGRILPQIHCYRADDMLSMLQVADEHGFQVRSFHHAIEAYKVRDVLAEREVSVSTWADWWGFKLEAYDMIPQNAALVAQAGARAVVHSDSAIGIQRLNQEAAKAWYSGLEAGIELPRHEALRWITANAAWTLGIDAVTGTLEPGKRADVVVWDADPFSVYARAERVYVGGVEALGPDVVPAWSDFERGQDAALQEVR